MRGQWAGKCGGVSVIFCDFRERICRLSCGQKFLGFGQSLWYGREVRRQRSEVRERRRRSAEVMNHESHEIRETEKTTS